MSAQRESHVAAMTHVLMLCIMIVTFFFGEMKFHG